MYADNLHAVEAQLKARKVQDKDEIERLLKEEKELDEELKQLEEEEKTQNREIEELAAY